MNHWSIKPRHVFAMVALGNILTVAAGFIGGITGVVRNQLLECCLAVLVTPVGWIGFFADRSTSSRSLGDVYLWTAFVLNSILWGCIAYRIARLFDPLPGEPGLDASTIIPRVTEVRQNHAAAIHSKSHPHNTRNEFIAAARETLTHFAYFNSRSPNPPDHHEPPKESI